MIQTTPMPGMRAAAQAAGRREGERCFPEAHVCCVTGAGEVRTGARGPGSTPRPRQVGEVLGEAPGPLVGASRSHSRRLLEGPVGHLPECEEHVPPPGLLLLVEGN